MTSVKAPVEWTKHHETVTETSDTSLRTSTRVREESSWTRDQTRVITDRTQQDVRFRIKEKLKSTTR